MPSRGGGDRQRDTAPARCSARQITSGSTSGAQATLPMRGYLGGNDNCAAVAGVGPRRGVPAVDRVGFHPACRLLAAVLVGELPEYIPMVTR